MPSSVYDKMAATTRKNVALRFLSSAREKTMEELLSELPDRTIAIIAGKLETIAEVKKQEKIKRLQSEIAEKEKLLQELKG